MSELDELFPPRPGGMIDSTRQQNAAAAAQLPGTVDDTDGPVAYSAVRVRDEPPDTGTAHTIPLSSANPVRRLLPHDPSRRRAVVLAITNDVYLTTDQGAAHNAQSGQVDPTIGYLPAGIAVPIDNTAEYWVAAVTTATASPVLLIVSKDSAP